MGYFTRNRFRLWLLPDEVDGNGPSAGFVTIHVIGEGLGDVGFCRLAVNVTVSFIQLDNVELHMLFVGVLLGVVLR